MAVSDSTNRSMLSIARGAAFGASALGVLKYFVLAIEEGGIANAPHFFLLLPVLLIVAGLWAGRGARAGLVLLVLMFLILAVLTVSAIVRLGFSQQNWADAVVVFVGLPLSLLGLYACVQVFRGHSEIGAT